MKQILRCILLVPVALIILSTESQAATKGQIIDQCSAALSNGDLEEASQFASEVSLFANIFSVGLQTGGVECLDGVYGEGWFFDQSSGSFLHNDPLILEKSLTALSESEMNKRFEILNSARLARKERLLKENQARLEKQSACVDVMIFRTNDNIETLDKIVNQANQSLIIIDTYTACTALYIKDQNAAMLNQSCIQAFEKIGHPNLQLDENDEKLKLSKELSDLRELRSKLAVNLLAASIEVLEASGSVTRGGIELAAKQEVEAKSCAEFGYENVYLD